MVSVSVARLSWLEREFLAGRSATVRFSFNPVTSTEKVSFVLGPMGSALPRRVCIMSAIAALRVSFMEGHIVTDKGHTHKGVGNPVVEFWIRSRSPIPSPNSAVVAEELVIKATASVELPSNGAEKFRMDELQDSIVKHGDGWSVGFEEGVLRRGVNTAACGARPSLPMDSPPAPAVVERDTVFSGMEPTGVPRSFRVTPGEPVVIRANVRSTRVIGELQPGAVVRGRVHDGCLHLCTGGVLKIKYVELLSGLVCM